MFGRRNVARPRPDPRCLEIFSRQTDFDPPKPAVIALVAGNVADGVPRLALAEDALVCAFEIAPGAGEERFPASLVRDATEDALLESAGRSGLIVQVADGIDDDVALAKQRDQIGQRGPAHRIAAIA